MRKIHLFISVFILYNIAYSQKDILYDSFADTIFIANSHTLIGNIISQGTCDDTLLLAMQLKDNTFFVVLRKKGRFSWLKPKRKSIWCSGPSASLHRFLSCRPLLRSALVSSGPLFRAFICPSVTSIPPRMQNGWVFPTMQKSSLMLVS